MKTPWICQRLDVKVGEWFTINRHSKLLRFRIKEDGTFETNPPKAAGASEALLRAIENPTMVYKMPFYDLRLLNAEDARDAETLRKMFPGRNITFERGKNGLCTIHAVGCITFTFSECNLFQFVKPGGKITIRKDMEEE